MVATQRETEMIVSPENQTEKRLWIDQCKHKIQEEEEEKDDDDDDDDDDDGIIW